MIEARVPCCSKNEAVCRKSGVVRPGKQAGVNLPLLDDGCIVEGDEAAPVTTVVVFAFFIKLWWNELSTSLSSSMLYKFVFSLTLLKLIDVGNVGGRGGPIFKDILFNWLPLELLLALLEIEKFNNESGSYGEFNLKIDEFYIM